LEAEEEAAHTAFDGDQWKRQEVVATEEEADNDDDLNVWKAIGLTQRIIQRSREQSSRPSSR
jgi:hypothetical protein